MNSQLEQFIGAKVEAQKALFAKGTTLSYKFRTEQLRKLSNALDLWQQPLIDALAQDLNKCYQEALLTEISIVKAEIKTHLRNLKRWMKPQRVATPLKLAPASSYITKQPLGTALIIAPWNYPMQLALTPLVGAISAGCTAVVKVAPATPHVAQVLVQMIGATFDENYITAIDGHREINNALLAQHFDLIFFTGSPALGKVVMKAAAEHLTPVVLELGGKSPVIVDQNANVRLAARRIAWGKALNAGQTCIAPDYLFVHSSLREQFVEEFGREVERLLGQDPAKSPHFGRIVSESAFARLESYLAQGKVVAGGRTIPSQRFIEPTLLVPNSTSEAVMSEEIFGPILPLLTFDSIDEVRDFVGQRPKPLALYYFGPRSKGQKLLRHLSSGGACLNDTIMHIVGDKVPFGGVGNSGMGNYHGRYSFEAFSHTRALLNSPTCIDLPFRYMPYKLFGLVKKLL